MLVFPASIVSASHSKAHSDKSGPQKQKTSNSKKKIQKKHQKYDQEVNNAFKEYKAKTAKVWGGKVVAPSAKVNVTYQKNLTQRSIMDFSDGSIKVELALDAEKSDLPSAVRKKLALAIQHAILVGADSRSIIDIAKQPNAPADAMTPVLNGLVADKNGEPLQNKDINDFLFSATKTYRLHPITGSEGANMVAVSAEFSLIEQHLIVRSKRYEDAVDRNADLHLIPASLIFAIMETESSFNPTAKSPVPAFGLMQLVPSKGARDAFRFLHSRDKVVKDTYLYQPDNNIDLGVAYLHMLHFRYFKYIEDPDAKKWAAVAAYNTGVSNVLQAFIGKYKRSKYGSKFAWRMKAMKKINAMTAEQVFNHMSKFLPYQETRDYINRVRDSIHKYHI